MKKLDFLLIFSLFIMLVAGSILIQYYLQQKSNECISNPLIFGAKQFSEELGYDFQGIGMFVGLPFGLKAPTVSFNSTSMTVKE